MIHRITTLADVQTFIEQLAQEIDDFHPLQDFCSYVYPDSYHRRYTDEESSIRALQLEQCFDVCATVTTDFFTYLLVMYGQIKNKLPRTSALVHNQHRTFLSHPYR